MFSVWISFVKYLLIAFALFYEICGIVLIVMGGIELDSYSKYSHFDFAQHYPLYFILIGALLMLFGFIGGYGAIKESQRIVLLFLILTAIGDIAIVIHGMFTNFTLLSTYRHDAEINAKKELNEGLKSFSDYRDDWDILQQWFSCCGVGHPGDWNAVLNSSTLPSSCCYPDSLGDSYCIMGSDTTGFHQNGCLPVLTEHIRNDFHIVIGFAWAKFSLTLITITSLGYFALMDRGYIRLMQYKTAEI